MKTLRGLLDVCAAQLGRGLDAASSMDDAAYVLRTALGAIGNEYVADLSLSQARSIQSLLGAVQAAARGIAAVTVVGTGPSEEPGGGPRVIRVFGLLDDLLNALLGTEARDPATPAVRLGLDGKVLVAQLGEALDGIDWAMEESSRRSLDADATGRDKPGAEPDLGAHPELLEFFQNLVGDLANQDHATLLQRVERVPSLLGDYDIEVERYDPAREHPSGLKPRDLFRFERARDGEGPPHRTVTPALVRGGRVLARGRVLLGRDA